MKLNKDGTCTYHGRTWPTLLAALAALDPRRTAK